MSALDEIKVKQVASMTKLEFFIFMHLETVLDDYPYQFAEGAAAELSALQKRVSELEKCAMWPLANWACKDCGYVNDGEWGTCLHCGEERK